VKSGRQKGDQEVLQGMDDQMRRMLCAGAEMEHRKYLRERINGQPEPDHLCGAAQPGAQFVQLEMWEPEVAEGALMQGLCVQGLRESERLVIVAADSPATRSAAEGSSPSASTVSTIATC
jgi:hypothetical protein